MESFILPSSFLPSSFAVTSLFFRFKLTSNLPQTYLKLTPCSDLLRMEIGLISNWKGDLSRDGGKEKNELKYKNSYFILYCPLFLLLLHKK